MLYNIHHNIFTALYNCYIKKSIALYENLLYLNRISHKLLILRLPCHRRRLPGSLFLCSFFMVHHSLSHSRKHD